MTFKRPIDVSEPWLDCLLEEYFNQSDREKIEGLPVAPFMDRYLKSVYLFNHNHLLTLL